MQYMTYILNEIFSMGRKKSGVIPGGSPLASESDMVQSPCPAVFRSFYLEMIHRMVPVVPGPAGTQM